MSTLWDYLVSNCKPGEPIFASDIGNGLSENNRRQQFKILTDSGKIRRAENGVYYIPQIDLLGNELPVSPDRIAECRYISRNNRVFGFYSGATFANMLGITTQNPFVREIVSNEIGNPIRKDCIMGREFLVRKSRTEITEKNANVLQFLELLKDIYRYSEISGEELSSVLVSYLEKQSIKKSDFDKYLHYYPDRIYKYIYETSVMDAVIRNG